MVPVCRVLVGFSELVAGCTDGELGHRGVGVPARAGEQLWYLHAASCASTVPSATSAHLPVKCKAVGVGICSLVGNRETGELGIQRWLKGASKEEKSLCAEVPARGV